MITLTMMQAQQIGNAVSAWIPVATMAATLVFWALMYNVNRSTRAEIQGMRSEWKEALREAVDRNNIEVGRVHVRFSEEVREMEAGAARHSEANDRHFSEVRRKIDELQIEHNRKMDEIQAEHARRWDNLLAEIRSLASQVAGADKILALLQQRVDFMSTEQQRRRDSA